jgi:hypothetical protein
MHLDIEGLRLDEDEELDPRFLTGSSCEIDSISIDAASSYLASAERL